MTKEQLKLYVEKGAEVAAMNAFNSYLDTVIDVLVDSDEVTKKDMADFVHNLAGLQIVFTRKLVEELSDDLKRHDDDSDIPF